MRSFVCVSSQRLKVGILETGETVVTRQRLRKHVPAATNTQATVEKLCFLCSPCRNKTVVQGEQPISCFIISADEGLISVTAEEMETAPWWELQWESFAQHAHVWEIFALLVSFTDSSISMCRLVGR
jgi:hypothetical protein